MRTTRTLFALVIASIFFVALLFSPGTVSAQKEGGQLVYPLTSEPRPFDPHHYFGEKNADNLIQHLYENLIYVDKQLKFQPCLATSWEMASDGKSCVFHLRKGVKFHDGTPFNAQAVAANFDRLANDRPNGWKFVGAWFNSTEIIDDFTIRINLKEVYLPFMTEMAQLYTRMASPAAIKKYGLDLGNNACGTGPWKFSEWVPGDKVVFVRNPYYWGGRPHLDKVIFRITPDMTTRMMGFESQSFDLLNEPQYVDIERLEKTGKYVSHSQVSSEIFHYSFNLVREPFDQKEVRHAIAYAINKPLIVKSLLGEKVLVANSFAPIHFPDVVIKEDAYAYNPEKAKEMLRNLGWKPGKDGILVKDGKRFQFNIMTPFGRYPMDKQITEAIQASLKEIGIDTKVEVVESAAFIKWLDAPCDEKRTMKIGMCARTRPMGASYEFAFIQHYHSDSTPLDNNSGCFANKEFDKYIIGARTLVDEKARGQAHRRAQEILFEELPAIPIFWYRTYMFNWPHVHDIDLFSPAYTPTPFVTHKTWVDK
jgi:peptide/nickel transport system substrate-binding protein